MLYGCFNALVFMLFQGIYINLHIAIMLYTMYKM